MTQQHDEKDCRELQQVARRMCLLLKERQPRKVEGVPPELHPAPPFVAKPCWTELGNAIKFAERPVLSSSIPGECWISLRCDGTGFSKVLPRLRRHGVFCQGYSETFGDIMVNCYRSLMEKFSAKCGYTQSDELTVLLAPTSVIRDVRQPHGHNGRVQKLCSLAAATVTARFNYHVMKLCKERDIEYMPELTVTFDCRVGQYQTHEEALSLILWRAYDCNVNGTAGAVYRCKGKIEGARKATGLTGDARLRWLHKHSRLPLHPHERDDTYLVKRKRVMEGMDQKTGQSITFLRSKIEQIHGNVLQLYQDDKLFPADEKMPLLPS